MSTSGSPKGLSIFFPAYNDSGTIASLVITALRTARKLTPFMFVAGLLLILLGLALIVLPGPLTIPPGTKLTSPGR